MPSEEEYHRSTPLLFRVAAEEYSELLTASPTKRRRDGPLSSPTPLKEESTNEDEDEDPEGPAYKTEQSSA